MIFSVFQKKIVYWGILCPTKHGGNHASRWIRDLWSKGVSLILSYSRRFRVFAVFDDFFGFSKKSGFWVFSVHLPMATIRIGREMPCLPYTKFLLKYVAITNITTAAVTTVIITTVSTDTIVLSLLSQLQLSLMSLLLLSVL